MRHSFHVSAKRIACFAMLGILLTGTAIMTHAQDGEDAFVLNGNAEAGKAAFSTYCVACHGESGKGDGIAAAALDPKPADYTDANRMSKLTDEDLYLVVKEGGTARGLSALMVAWKGALTDQQIRDVVAYVRTFAAKAE